MMILRAMTATASSLLLMTAVQAAPTRPVQLSKVVLNPAIAKTDQKVKVGTICLFSGAPLDFGTNERTMNVEGYERLFIATMEKRGYSIVGKSTDMFEGESLGPKPDFLIGATLRPVSVNICDSVNGQKGTIAMSVEWKVFDRARREVVATVNSAGQGVLPKFSQNGLREMIDQAFTVALDALLDQGALAPYLGKPGPAA